MTRALASGVRGGQAARLGAHFWRFRGVRGCASRYVAGFVVAVSVSEAAAQEPHGYVEPCTVGNVQEMYTECELCSASAGEPEACNTTLGRKGFEKKCRTRENTAGWGEVWCIAKLPAEPAASGNAPSGPDAASGPAAAHDTNTLRLLMWAVVPALLGAFVVLRRVLAKRGSAK